MFDFTCNLSIDVCIKYLQSELEPIKDRVREEIVGQFHMSEKFISARAEHMLGALNYIDNK